MGQLENLSSEKLRGGYYTPIEIANFIVRWGMEIKPEIILEPSCGNGVFIDSISHYIKQTEEPQNECKLIATELISSEADISIKKHTDLCEETGFTGKVFNKDFFEFVWKESGEKGVLEQNPDLIIGNPPYIRYQSFIHGRDIAEKKLFQHGVETTKHANSWLYFLVESVTLLRQDKDSRLGMVIPAELLHVTYAKGLRRWLEEKLTKIRILTFEELVFPNVQQEVIVLLAEFDPGKIKKNTSNKAELKLLQFKNMGDVPENVWNYSNEEVPLLLENQDKWTSYFLNSDQLEIYKKSRNKFKKFENYASINIGIVTGANKFFGVTKSELKNLGFRDSRNYDGVEIRPLMGRSSEVSGIIFTEKDFMKNNEIGKRCNLITFEKDYPRKRLHKIWKKRIESGELEELDKRYKCKIRSPWYWIPYVWTSPISMFKRSSEYTRLVVNEKNALTTDTVYRIKRKENTEFISDKHFVFSFINSLTFLSCELEGRYYGGGVLELVPSEVEKVTIPINHHFTEENFEIVDNMLREKKEIDEILDYTDPILLSKLSKKERLDVRKMWKILKNRRIVRGGSMTKGGTKNE